MAVSLAARDHSGQPARDSFQLVDLPEEQVGLVLIGLERPMGDSLLAFALVLVAALAWAFANIATKRAGASDMLRLICWVSLVPPLPLLALSWVFEGPQAMVASFEHATLVGYGSLLFVAFGATTLGFAIWSFLLSRHRLNVAISRAQHTAYLVHAPQLTDFVPGSPAGLERLGAFLGVSQAGRRG